MMHMLIARSLPVQAPLLAAMLGAATLWLAGCTVPVAPAKTNSVAPVTASAPAATPVRQATPPVAPLPDKPSVTAGAVAPPAASAPIAIAAAPTAAASAAPAPAPPIMPFNEAVLFAANNLFKNANLESANSSRSVTRLPLVIDPLVDGNSGFQSVATETMEGRIGALVKSQYPNFELQPFNTATLARGPMLFIGTLTAVNMDGTNKPGRDWHRVCLALLDLRSGKIVSKGFARAALEGVDLTPTAFFLDSPAWAPDPAVAGYVATCQGTRAGDPIKPAYYDRIVAAAMINDAIVAYNRGDYEEAFDLYKGVLRQPGGDQLRVYQGLYLAASKLNRKEDAQQAFARIVDHGLAQSQLGVKFLFRPGSTLFERDPQVTGAYPMWLGQLSQRASERTTCLEIAGHTSRTGPEPLNERLSLMRAQYIKQRLDAAAPALAKRTSASGKGSSQNLSGLGTDDARDALDRRVEFKVKDCLSSD
jgi:outer membrane protein OmpA-like peptidoglycan-associated protein